MKMWRKWHVARFMPNGKLHISEVSWWTSWGARSALRDLNKGGGLAAAIRAISGGEWFMIKGTNLDLVKKECNERVAASGRVRKHVVPGDDAGVERKDLPAQQHSA